MESCGDCISRSTHCKGLYHLALLSLGAKNGSLLTRRAAAWAFPFLIDELAFRTAPSDERFIEDGM